MREHKVPKGTEPESRNKQFANESKAKGLSDLGKEFPYDQFLTSEAHDTKAEKAQNEQREN